MIVELKPVHHLALCFPGVAAGLPLAAWSQRGSVPLATRRAPPVSLSIFPRSVFSASVISWLGCARSEFDLRFPARALQVSPRQLDESSVSLRPERCFRERRDYRGWAGDLHLLVGATNWLCPGRGRCGPLRCRGRRLASCHPDRAQNRTQRNSPRSGLASRIWGWRSDRCPDASAR